VDSLTVVIASANYGHLAAHCIESVLCQTRPADKILFVDDAFGDCKHLTEKYDLEYLFRESNLGVLGNFQDVLFNHVSTERVLFIGADNWLRPDAIELLSKKTADIVTYDIVVTGTKRKNIVSGNKNCYPYQGDFYWPRINQYHGSMMYRVNQAKECGGYAKGGNWIVPAEDLGLWNNLIKSGATFDHVPEGLLYYRRHEHNFFKYPSE
jgi:glycosyltransferase involved in cell wall biosynthesis